MFRKEQQVPIFFIIALMASLLVIAYFSEISIGELWQSTIDRRISDTINLANVTGDRINDAISVIDGTSRLPEMTSTPYANLINIKLHGIPQDVDVPKRMVAENILQHQKIFESIRFLLPNGNMYMLEPFSAQKNLKQNNFAFRDFYQGVMATREPYLSSTYVAQSTGDNVTTIAAPVFSNNGTLIGIWGGAMNTIFIQNYIQNHYLAKTGLVAILDQDGNLVACSGLPLNVKLQDLDIYKKAISGQMGTDFENIGDTKMFVSYSPIKTTSSTWVLIIMRPYDQAFLAYETAKNQLYLMISGVALFVTVFGLYLKKTFNSMNKITRHLQDANDSLSISEEKYRNLYNYSPDLLRSISLEGNILDCNNNYTKSLGYAKEEVIGKSIFDHTSEKSINALSEGMKVWKETGKITNQTIWLKRRDGSEFPTLLSGTNLYDDKDRIVGRTVSLKDMTEIYSTKQALEEEKTKRLTTIGELSSRLSHDIRNPLSVIHNAVELLILHKQNMDEKELSLINMIDRSALRISYQIEDVLNFVRSTDIKKESSSILQILNACVDKMTLPDNITIILPKNDLQVDCDKIKLEIVFENIINNAIQGIDANKGEITVVIRNEFDSDVIEISDSGHGIPPEVLPHIFEPLFTTKRSGTGLGLPTCRNLIEQHGWTMQVKLPSTFVIKIPRRE